VVTGARRVAIRVDWKPPGWLWRLPAYAIGGLASFWVIERLAAF
jgi:hypothetical protein